LPIPFDASENLRYENRHFRRDVARTNNYLITNYTQEERLLLHEFTLEQAEKKGLPLKNWYYETFLKRDNDDISSKNKTESK
jgi:hypothetical protein